jgi:8-oxo-dGTP pyrophosphatase MutT (NUDIX family)
LRIKFYASKDLKINSYISEKFEFPGGKIEQGETQEEALKRELLRAIL